MIKESCNLIGQEAQLTRPSLISDANFPWWISPRKKLRDQLILFRDIDEQRILQSDWTRGTTDQTQANVAVSDANPWWLTPCKKTKI